MPGEEINVREYRRCNEKWDNPEKKAREKNKAQHNMCWTSLYVSKHK
jgi:hypothetical protein